MVYKLDPSYLWLKGRTYYYNRHVPRDVQSYYSCRRLVICLKTHRHDLAVRSAKGISQRLEEYWLSLRMARMDIPALHLVKSGVSTVVGSACVSLSEALELYVRLKGSNKGKTFHRGAERNIEAVLAMFGDRPLDGYTSADAASFRDYLLERGLTTNSVKRNFSTIRSIINLSIQEHGLDIKNAFSRVFLPDLDDTKKRKPIPIDYIRLIQKDCMQIDDDARRLVALISDTGMRLSEAAGLHVDDIILDHEVPHVDLKPHPWRSLKTKGSQRQIPLVGASLWAARRIKDTTTSPYAFPRYTSAKGTIANSASAAINKWLKPRVPDGCVIHSFRHSLRDRLRAVQCPSDMIDQIGGWTTAGVGQAYGEGYLIRAKQKQLTQIASFSILDLYARK